MFNCLSAGCSNCCIQTFMPLSLADIRRLQALGFKVKDFVVERGGERRLKNRDGRCFFLTDEGCSVYEDRPTGCRYYPLVLDDDDEVMVDPECSHSSMFSVGEVEAEELVAFIQKLKREKKRKMPK